MRILIAPDKFKGSLSASEAAEAMRAGFSRVFPEAVIDCIPLADGGEGLLDVFNVPGISEYQNVIVHDALGRQVKAQYLLTEIDGLRVGIIESSQACGIWRIAPSERDLPNSSTHGVGELILAAAFAGADKILVGLGGSATNDAGLGMAQAIGFRFEDSTGNEVRAIPSAFPEIKMILRPVGLKLPPITIACDVRNPLLGLRGATRVYGPQKGLRPEDADMLESGHRHVTTLVKKHLGVDYAETPGAGAAGGLGFGLLAFCDAALQSGFDCIADFLSLDEKIKGASLVVTGEGGMDAQTLEGKVPAGVAEIARRHGVPVVALAGNLADEEMLSQYFDAFASLVNGPMSVEQACENASMLLEKAALRMARTIALSLR